MSESLLSQNQQIRVVAVEAAARIVAAQLPYITGVSGEKPGNVVADIAFDIEHYIRGDGRTS